MGTLFTPIAPLKKMEFSSSESVKGTDALLNEGSLPFQAVLEDSFNELAAAEKASAEDAIALALGNADNLEQIQINALKAEVALQTTVQLTSRIINAYKEIMQMQI